MQHDSDDPARQAVLEELGRLALETYGEERRAEPTLKTALEAAAPDLPALHGVPFGAKDIFDSAGLATAGNFRPYTSRTPVDDAEPVARLKRAGAILLGKLVTTQFAYADPSPTRNPWSDERTPGGSSSGSARRSRDCAS